MKTIEYKVRPVTRYMVTRYEEGENCAGSESCGLFDRQAAADTVAAALYQAEASRAAQDGSLSTTHFILSDLTSPVQAETFGAVLGQPIGQRIG